MHDVFTWTWFFLHKTKLNIPQQTNFHCDKIIKLNSKHFKNYTNHPTTSEMTWFSYRIHPKIFFGSQWKEGSFVMLRIGVTATSAQDLFVWANTDTHFCIEEEEEEKAALRDERRSLSDETRRRKNISQSRCVYIQSLTKVFNTFNISDQAFQTHPAHCLASLSWSKKMFWTWDQVETLS